MNTTPALRFTVHDVRGLGLDESGARPDSCRENTERPKSSVSERWEHSDRVLLGCNALFEKRVRPTVDVDEEVHKFVAIDVETGKYEVDESEVEATDRLIEREPEAKGRIWFRRVGYEYAPRLGSLGGTR